MSGVFGLASGPIFLTNLLCKGDEGGLLKCPSSGVSFLTSCSDNPTAAGVVCTGIHYCMCSNIVTVTPDSHLVISNS